MMPYKTVAEGINYITDLYLDQRTSFIDLQRVIDVFSMYSDELPDGDNLAEAKARAVKALNISLGRW